MQQLQPAATAAHKKRHAVKVAAQLVAVAEASNTATTDADSGFLMLMSVSFCAAQCIIKTL